MNRRQWKKACKKAAAEVARRWPGEYDFEPAAGDETVYAPPGYVPPRGEQFLWFRGERRRCRSAYQYAAPPRGAPVMWTHDSYTNESECETALSVLRERLWVESVDWEAEALKLDASIPLESAAA